MECIEARALKAGFCLKWLPILRCTATMTFGVSPELAPQRRSFISRTCSTSISPRTAGFPRKIEEEADMVVKKNSFPAFSGADEFDALSAREFTDPVEGLESLEWLSQFAEDSSAELSLLCPTRSFTLGDSVNNPPMKAQATFVDVEVPRKRRSKRPLTNALPWALVPPPLNSVDSSSTSSSSHGSSSLSVFVFPHPAPDLDWLSSAEKSSSPPPEKKPKRNPENQNSMRRCTHCLVQKTPQWRTGPLGPKTLCNACGVRFKSGRLFPEYRPACSPTFSQEVHSNSHRKVLEMRRMKEMATTATAIDEHSGFVSPVVSIGVSD